MRLVRFLSDHPPYRKGGIARLNVPQFHQFKEAGLVEELDGQQPLSSTSAPEPENRDPEPASPANGNSRRKRA